ncbi:1,2-epoxyphenylacetyl-CoA isomerase [Nocardia sp. RB56]|uniref:1,2-epoxyphenylacetyl-CoA isomerase n=1 Tax=Nocardia aurantia TaxID=2585199 RepID=A0A7K0E3U0_9NOCA|nr:crotonase/enoyl-CoA hydratase family protein [Nocardia aurantia]MQY31824.1 1,2-epoxyphenylacetyl-CoA isomerase [Nocardia aurantia]
MHTTEIVYEVADGIATITLNRPARLNAFTQTMAGELLAAFDEVDADDEVRVVILTGAGRGFCAGADLGDAGVDTFSAERLGHESAGMIDGAPRDSGGAVSLRIAGCRKPVISAYNGAAVGVGVTMTLPTDIRIAAESAKFGFVFARRGLVPEAASAWFLPRVVGISQAMEWVATGRVFGAEEARAGGLVSRVVPDEELLPAATAVAREIADHTSGVSVAASRQLLWGMLGSPTPWDAHRYDSKAIFELGKGADVAEGVAAFLEKRPARFPSRVSKDFPSAVPRWPVRPDAY